MTSQKSLLLACALCTFVLFLPVGCQKQDKTNSPLVEKPVPVAPPPAPTPPPPKEKLPPPTKAEVAEAMHRIFGENVVISPGFNPSFIVGDFNGDYYEDLAVIVRPVPEKLNEINNDLANWTIQDAEQVFVPPADKTVVTPPKFERAHIDKNDQLLAVIHGFGPKGWRSPDARQSFLVKHAAATFLGIAPSNSDKSIQMMKVPVKTDIIKASRHNKQGVLFWTGAKYAWHANKG